MYQETIEKVLLNDKFASKIFCSFETPDITESDNFCIERKSEKKTKDQRPFAIVYNTDDSDGPGIHWCAAIFHPNLTAEFFDSYGQPPSAYNLQKNLLKYADNIYYINKRVQGFLPTCGHHVLFYLLQRCRNVPPHVIYSKYYSDYRNSNDSFVFQFIKKNFGSKMANFVSV